MKNALILLAITIILVGVCGCTQTAPPVQPMTTSPTSPQTTQLLTVATIPVLQTTTSVSDNTIRIKNLAFDPTGITVTDGINRALGEPGFSSAQDSVCGWGGFNRARTFAILEQEI